ncbi:MAG: hypothetical protein OD918_11750 [Gammaproteobacteria bacterium]
MTRLHAHDAGVATLGYVLPARALGGNENLPSIALKEIAEIESVMSDAAGCGGDGKGGMTRLHAHDAGVAALGYVLPVCALGGNENLSSIAPKETAEIESVMSDTAGAT